MTINSETTLGERELDEAFQAAQRDATWGNSPNMTVLNRGQENQVMIDWELSQPS